MWRHILRVRSKYLIELKVLFSFQLWVHNHTPQHSHYWIQGEIMEIYYIQSLLGRGWNHGNIFHTAMSLNIIIFIFWLVYHRNIFSVRREGYDAQLLRFVVLNTENIWKRIIIIIQIKTLFFLFDFFYQILFSK